ncbi:MAG: acyltransferase [Devosia sp.]
MSASAPSAADRIGAMDGLRGWAALAVVIFHFTWEMFGHSMPEFRSLLPAFLGSGRLAVAIFFTLSGYVLTVRRWRRDDNPPYRRVALKRYVRLTIPIFISAMLFFALMVLGLTPTQQAADILQNYYWMGSIAGFQPNLLEAIFFGLLGAYGLQRGHLYHPFLWTMIIELWASLLVFWFSQGWKWLFREPYTPLIVSTLIFLWVFPLAACFFLGAIVALMQRDGRLFRDPPSARESLMATIVFVAGVCAATFMHVRSEMFTPETVRGLIPASLTGVVVTFAAVRSAPVARILMTGASQAMGRLSFPLYLAHGIIAASFAPALVVWTNAMGPIDTLDASLISLASILASLALAQMLLPVETFTLGFVRRFDRRKASA